MRESTLSTWTLPRYLPRIDLRPWIPNWIPADFLSVSNLSSSAHQILAKPDIGSYEGPLTMLRNVEAKSAWSDGKACHLEAEVSYKGGWPKWQVKLQTFQLRLLLCFQVGRMVRRQIQISLDRKESHDGTFFRTIPS